MCYEIFLNRLLFSMKWINNCCNHFQQVVKSSEPSRRDTQIQEKELRLEIMRMFFPHTQYIECIYIYM